MKHRLAALAAAALLPATLAVPAYADGTDPTPPACDALGLPTGCPQPPTPPACDALGLPTGCPQPQPPTEPPAGPWVAWETFSALAQQYAELQVENNINEHRVAYLQDWVADRDRTIARQERKIDRQAATIRRLRHQLAQQR